MKKPENKELSINNEHQLIINEWFANGFNATQATLKYKPDLSYHMASTIGSSIINNKKNQDYINHRKHLLSLDSNITATQVLNELKNFAFADITVFLGKTEQEIQELPSDVRRTLKRVSIKQKNYVNNSGGETSETTTTYEIHDKLSAFEKISKHIGFYAEDNKQKQGVIDLSKATPEQLNVLLSLIESQKQH